MPILYIDDSDRREAARAACELRRTRDDAAVQPSLDALQAAARGPDNTMPPLLDCVRAYATVGEMCDALRRGVGGISGSAAHLASSCQLPAASVIWSGRSSTGTSAR